jgi:hypothetical protein
VQRESRDGRRRKRSGVCYHMPVPHEERRAMYRCNTLTQTQVQSCTKEATIDGMRWAPKVTKVASDCLNNSTVTFESVEESVTFESS